MYRKLLALLVLTLFGTAGFAQSTQITGVISDNASTTKLKLATIAVLNAKDSTLYKFTRAGENGNFSIKDIKNGNFILLVTYPEYADFVDRFTIDATRNNIDFKVIDMKSKAKLLNEVIIKGQVAGIKIKGDTTEFNAAAYKINANDRVEDLIKQFPGLQVDSKGQITAQGKKVEKVLVDGEEFFGDDPTLVTKNLRADMVAKVQLFEKSSDQAAFTGVDDGEKKQTLNIVLKDDKKKGYFGKVDAGYGTDKFYEGQAMINIFRNKEKMAAYFTGSNTGKTGLGWDDAGKYGASGNMEVTDDGMMFISGGDALDGGGSYWGEGIPKAYNGGLHYENKWNEDKQSINTNYKVGALNVKTIKNTLNQNNLVSGIITTNSDNNSESDMFRQKLDFTYNIKIDTTATLKLVVDGTLKNTESDNAYEATGLRGDNSTINTSNRLTTNKTKQQLFNLDALFTKKLKKTGRNYSLRLNQNYNKNNGDGFLKSDNKFYDINGNLTQSENIDQYKDNDILSNRFAANFTYTEPLSKFVNLVANYGITYTINDAHKKTYDASAPERYDQINSIYTNHFLTDQTVNQLGAIFYYKKGKAVLDFGTKTNFVKFDQKEKYTNQTFNRSFINWLPQLRYQYKFSAQKAITARYNGTTTQPTVSQLQPIKTNDDPLNIQEGNPLLKPSYTNDFNAYFNSYKMLTSRNIYLSGSFGFTNNAIVSDNQTDAEGRTIYRSVNLTDKLPSYFRGYGGFSRKIKFLGDINFGTSFNLSSNTNYNYISDAIASALNTTKSFEATPSINVSKYGEKGGIHISFGPKYFNQQASLQKNYNNKGWGRSGWLDGSIKLPQKFTLGANAEYTFEPSSQAFNQDFEQMIITANLTKAFFKQETFKLRVTANDILNQNKGFRRYTSGNSIIQNSYNNIGRYFLFSLIWDFNKMGGTPKAN